MAQLPARHLSIFVGGLSSSLDVGAGHSGGRRRFPTRCHQAGRGARAGQETAGGHEAYGQHAPAHRQLRSRAQLLDSKTAEAKHQEADADAQNGDREVLAPWLHRTAAGYSGRISAAVLAPAIIGDPSPVPKLPVTEYSSEHHCLFQLHARIFLTWRQAAEFCALFNATLPVLRTQFAWQTLRSYAQNHRIWVGVVRAEGAVREGSQSATAGDQDLWRWYTDGPEEPPLSTSDFSRTDNRTGVEWSRSEPSNAHCGEACGVVNYDGNLADYACATVPPWDPCGDESHVVRTVCQRSGLP
uniref:C-type lectin domain-containing protein n=1 Tax=Macrostomum lignano TaxID=282301 RepID=A0A1I8G8U9_9PLAT